MAHAVTHGRVSRRSLLGGALAATAAAALPGGAFAAGSDRIRVGLVGCGGRGVGAAIQALSADEGVDVVALGDLFADQVSLAADAIDAHGRRPRPLVRCVGPRAAEQVIAAEIDLVILATPPHLRPDHAALAVRSGRHVFCETPIAVDATGVRTMLAVATEARARGVSAVCGFQARHHAPTAAAIDRIHGGSIGRVTRVVAVSELGLTWRRPRLPAWSDAEHEIRNWIRSPQLSGGPFVEHQVHAIDRALWALGDASPELALPIPPEPELPAAAEAPEAARVVFRFSGGRMLVAGIERRAGIETRVEETVSGTRGGSDLRATLVATTAAAGPSPHASCMAAFVRGIRSGRRLDDVDRGCRSTLVAILGREAVRTGVPVRWDDVWAEVAGGQSIQPLQSAGV